jgi:hypothetical protein
MLRKNMCPDSNRTFITNISSRGDKNLFTPRAVITSIHVYHRLAILPSSNLNPCQLTHVNAWLQNGSSIALSRISMMLDYPTNKASS